MTDLRTAAQQALEAMEYHVEQTRSIWKTSQAIDALRDALAQQTQTPCDIAEDGVCEVIDCCRTELRRLHAENAALRAALAQQDEPKGGGNLPPPLQAESVQEPVAWMVYTLDGKPVCVTDNPADLTERYKALPLYTAPPRREWEGLTKEDVAQNLRSRYDAAKLLEERRQKIAQPRREWQSLSEDELTALGVIHSRYQEESLETGGWFDFARAIEAALKEKNQ